ncbi:MAG: acetyltransferase [Microcystaceae cyanobacterium]
MSEKTATPISQAELTEAISELEQSRQRIVNDITTMSKKLKLSSKKVEQDLAIHPEIVRIDAILEQLRTQLNEF